MTRWSIAGGSIGAFTVLAFLVYFGLLDNVDSIVGEWARPHDVWGPAQVRADLIVNGLRPVVLASLLCKAAVTETGHVRRRCESGDRRVDCRNKDRRSSSRSSWLSHQRLRG